MKQRSDGRWVKTMTIDKKRVYFYSVEKTQRMAEIDINKQIRNYTEKVENGYTFDYVFAEWEDEYEKTVSFTTFYKSKAKRQRIEDYFTGEYLTDITTYDVNRFVDSMSASLSHKTIKDTISLLRVFFNYAMTHKHPQAASTFTESNPCDHITIRVGKQSNTRELPHEKVIQKIKDNADSGTMGLFAYFLLYTGLRKGEALALTFDDIDIENKIIHVNKTLVYNGSQGFIKPCTKTEAGMRDVNILSVLLPKLPKGKKGAPVFANTNGDYITNSQYSRMWNKYLKETGIQDILDATGTTLCAHQLRHAFATTLYEAEIPEKDAQELMGHADIQTTHKIYTHISEKRKKATLDKLENFISNQE